MDKSILETIHETMEDLHEVEVIDKKTMRKYDALCLSPVKSYSAGQIKRIRNKNNASQPVFAAYLNTSPSTIKQWEQGVKKPNGPSMKLLNIVDKNGLEALG